MITNSVSNASESKSLKPPKLISLSRSQAKLWKITELCSMKAGEGVGAEVEEEEGEAVVKFKLEIKFRSILKKCLPNV